MTSKPHLPTLVEPLDPAFPIGENVASARRKRIEACRALERPELAAEARTPKRRAVGFYWVCWHHMVEHYPCVALWDNRGTWQLPGVDANWTDDDLTPLSGPIPRPKGVPFEDDTPRA